MKVWLDDGLVDVAEARVSVFDRGFRSGEGVFETFRSYDGHPFRLEAHLERAAAGAGTLGFDLPDRGLLRDAVRRTADANTVAGRDLALRLTVTPGRIDPDSAFPGTPSGGPLAVVTAHRLAIPPTVYEEGITAVLVPRVRELPEVKAVSYLTASLAKREAKRRGGDEALLVDPDGSVLEGSYSNVFAVLAGVLVTPPVTAGILPGVTRAVVLDLAAYLDVEVAQRTITSDELVAADEVLVTATTREVVPVTAIDGQPVGDGRSGPLAQRLLAAYRDEVRREIEVS